MRFSFIAVLLGAIVLAFAGIASADTVVGSTGKSIVGGTSGKGMQVGHYTATYTDGVFGPVSCTGINQTKSGKQMQEQFTCTSTSSLPLTGISPNQTITWGPNTWLSDFNGTSLDQTFAATASADGMSYTAVATY
jgi:hypothetical protein